MSPLDLYIFALSFSSPKIALKGELGSLYITSLLPFRFSIKVLLNDNIYRIEFKASKRTIPPSPKFCAPKDELLHDKKIKAEEDDLVMRRTLKLFLNFDDATFCSHIRFGPIPTAGVKLREGGIVNFINAACKKRPQAVRI